MAKYRKSFFPDYRDVSGESISELIGEVLGSDLFSFEESHQACSPLETDRCVSAHPPIETLNQEWLCAYFDEHIDFHPGMIDAYLDEANADSPNYDLFYRYFLQGAPNLKKLLLACIDRYPSDPALLNDLAHMHAHAFMLEELADRYRRACQLETDPEAFAELVQGYFFNTVSDDFDAFYDLRVLFRNDPEKSAIIEYLIEHFGLEEQTPSP